MRKPIVALTGRPNVGKSTLFNRLAGEQLAIVDDVPGTTRDRLFATSIWNGVEFDIIDTGGIDPPAGEILRFRSAPQIMCSRSASRQCWQSRKQTLYCSWWMPLMA